jgi:nucleoside-diphosphate-sugar epimerase
VAPEASNRSLRAVPARSTESTPTTWSTRLSRHPPGKISPERSWRIGTGELVTIRAILEQIVETVGTGVDPDFGALSERPLEIVRKADVERTNDLLRWQRRTTLTEGLESIVDWYRKELARE